MPVSRQDIDEESVERAIIAFLEQVNADMDALDLTAIDKAAASDRSARVEPLHVFVFCRQLEHQAGGLHRAEIAVTLVSNFDDTDNPTRRDWRTRIGQRLNVAQPWRSFFDDQTGMRSHGWKVTGPNEISESGSQSTGDVWVLLAGFTRQG